MKDLDTIAGRATLELPGVTRPGRKPKGERPLTAAERQRKYRASHVSVNLGEKMTSTISRLAADFDLTNDEVMQHLVRFALCNRNWFDTGFPSKEAQQ